MLAMRGRWELSASASLFAAFRLLVAVVLLLGPIADSAENASPTAASLWLTLTDNCTNVRLAYPNGSTKHIVNGKTTAGWFSVDYDMKDLSQVSLAQEMLFRTNKFDASLFPILNVEDLVAEVGPVPLWLNIQNDLFYRQHNLSMRKYLLSLSKHVSPNYVSSPEVVFLRSIVARFRNVLHQAKVALIYLY